MPGALHPGPALLFSGRTASPERTRGDAAASCALQHARDRERNPVPPPSMLFQLPSSRRGQPVILGVSIILAGPPVSLQLSILLQPVQRGEQRPRVDLETFVTERRE